MLQQVLYNIGVVMSQVEAVGYVLAEGVDNQAVYGSFRPTPVLLKIIHTENWFLKGHMNVDLFSFFAKHSRLDYR